MQPAEKSVAEKKVENGGNARAAQWWRIWASVESGRGCGTKRIQTADAGERRLTLIGRHIRFYALIRWRMQKGPAYSPIDLVPV